MENTNEKEFIKEYNKVYGEILRREREKRQISREKLTYGIMSRTALEKVEKGDIGWPKAAGDILMQRMGISANYFETLSSAEELDRWRLREDICLLVPDSPREAREKLKEYREKYKKREPLEEQFLWKADAMLLLAAWEAGEEGGGDQARASEEILSLALQAADCTIPKGWVQGGKLAELLLSPGELEAILLVSAALFCAGRAEEAWELQQAVWDYPGGHQWAEGLQVLILPQAAILGIRILQGTEGAGRDKSSLNGEAFRYGKEAFGLLRRSCCQCYALPLLECICGLSAERAEEREYLEQAGKFRDAFREIYQWFGCPGHRIWQGISADNTLEVGMVLKMLRKFYGTPRADAIYDEGDMVITQRQLEKIEKGVHKPSYENYNRLAKQYGKHGGWNMPLLEMASTDVLELRQEISKLIEFREYGEAEWEVEALRRKVDIRYPRNRQEMLFLDAILYKHKEGASLEKCLGMMLEALHYTVPGFEGREMKWWVFQREELLLAANIASLYRRLGRLEEAEKWFETVIFSVEQQSGRTGVGNYGYDLLMDNYDNYLGDIQCYDEAVRMNEECIEKLLRCSKINGMRSILYRIAWNAYEAAAKRPDTLDILQQKWRKAFRLSGIMADFMYDVDLKKFLDERKQKYLYPDQA